jgi:hypothetical protein
VCVHNDVDITGRFWTLQALFWSQVKIVVFTCSPAV